MPRKRAQELIKDNLSEVTAADLIANGLDPDNAGDEDDDDPGVDLNARAAEVYARRKPEYQVTNYEPPAAQTQAASQEAPPIRTDALPNPECSSLTHIHLNQAVDYLMSALSVYVRDGIKAQADLLRIPRWQLVCGLLVQLHQSGGLSNPALDPSWMSENPVIEQNGICQNPDCGQSFVPRWRNQKYCSSDCGHQMEIKRQNEIAKRRKAALLDETVKWGANEKEAAGA